MIQIDTNRPVLPQLKRLGIVVGWHDDALFITAQETILNQDLHTQLERYADKIGNELANAHLASLDRFQIIECGPITPSQERLLDVEAEYPGANSRQRPRVLDIRGPLNLQALKNALTELTERQKALRTIFRIRQPDSVPIQLVLSEITFDFTVYDVRTDPHPEEATQRIVQEESARPFSIFVGPLFRAAVALVDADNFKILLSTHHLICDGWSFALILKELSLLYRSAIQGQEAVLPPLPQSFCEIATQLNQQRRSTKAERSRDYWLQQLAPPWAPSSIQPVTAPQATTADVLVSATVGELALFLEKDLVAALEQYAAKRFLTLSSILIGVFAQTLYHKTGMKDIRIGTMASGRSLLEVEHLVGFFSNLVVLRFRLTKTPSTNDWPQWANDLLRQALLHQDLPVQDVINALGSEYKSINSAHLYNIMFVHNNVPAGHLDIPNTLCEIEDLAGGIRQQRTMMDLRIELNPYADGSLYGHLVYKNEKYEQPIIEELWNHYIEELENLSRH